MLGVSARGWKFRNDTNNSKIYLDSHSTGDTIPLCTFVNIYRGKGRAMEDLWRIHEQDYRLSNISERAEYERLVRRFHEDEERENIKNLLYGTGRLTRTKDVESK